MIRIFHILFLFIIIGQPQSDPLYNKQGKPSTYGINAYIKNNQEDLIKEYEYRVDTLYDVYIFTENLSKTSSGDLGEFYLPDYVVITNEEKYIAYEFKELSKFKQKTVSYTERTVKAVLFHELTHAYFNQTLLLMVRDSMNVSPEYGTFRMFPSPASRFSSTFIEEGVCEYVVYYLQESAPIKDIPIPDNITDLTDDSNKVNNLYGYSVIYLRDFLDKHGLKEGIQILIRNKPPSYEEILNPNLFFNRLK